MPGGKLICISSQRENVMRDEIQLSLVSALLGLSAGISLAVAFNLFHTNLSDDLLSFLGNILGAALGAAIAVVFAYWAAGSDRRRARSYDVQQALRHVQSLLDPTHDLATKEGHDFQSALGHAQVARDRLRQLLGDPDLTDYYLRRAYSGAADAFENREQAIVAAQFPAVGKKRRSPADELVMELSKIIRGYQRIRL